MLHHFLLDELAKLTCFCNWQGSDLTVGSSTLRPSLYATQRKATDRRMPVSALSSQQHGAGKPFR